MRTYLVFLAVLVIPAIAHAATLKVPGQYPTIQCADCAAHFASHYAYPLYYALSGGDRSRVDESVAAGD